MFTFQKIMDYRTEQHDQLDALETSFTAAATGWALGPATRYQKMSMTLLSMMHVVRQTALDDVNLASSLAEYVVYFLEVLPDLQTAIEKAFPVECEQRNNIEVLAASIRRSMTPYLAENFGQFTYEPKPQIWERVPEKVQ